MTRAVTSGHQHLPADVRQVLLDHPGISLVRAHQVAGDRKILRQRAARQAMRNRFGQLHQGGIGQSASSLLNSFEQLSGEPDWWGIDWATDPDATAIFEVEHDLAQ